MLENWGRPRLREVRHAGIGVVFVALMLAATPASAATILVQPAGSGPENFWPTSNGSIHWQQVYDDSFFGSSTVQIDSFGFLGFEQFNGTIAYSDFDVRMSTTAVEAGAMSTTYASNVGSDETLVRSGAISISNTAGVFTMFALTTPFIYDPTMGNLLIDIQHGSATSGSTIAWVGYDPTPAGLQRIANSPISDPGEDFDKGELVTQFATATVPEPATLLLLGTGLGMGAYRRRRKQ